MKRQKISEEDEETQKTRLDRTGFKQLEEMRASLFKPEVDESKFY